jgi:hypothetical protein
VGPKGSATLEVFDNDLRAKGKGTEVAEVRLAVTSVRTSTGDWKELVVPVSGPVVTVSAPPTP